MSRKYYYTPFLNSDANERDTWNKYRQKGYVFLRTENCIPVRREKKTSKSLEGEGARGLSTHVDTDHGEERLKEAQSASWVHYIEPEDLAKHLVRIDRLPNIKVNIKLLVCWGGGATPLDAEYAKCEFEQDNKNSIAARVARAIKMELQATESLPIVGGYLGPTETKEVGKKVQVNPLGKTKGEKIRLPAKPKNWTSEQANSEVGLRLTVQFAEDNLVRWFDGNGVRTSKYAATQVQAGAQLQVPARFAGLGEGDVLAVMGHGDLLTGRIYPFAGSTSESFGSFLVNKVGRSERGLEARTGKAETWEILQT